MAGVSWIDHVLPFQCSARVNPAPLLVRYSPTAVQLVGAAHETCCSALLVVTAGLGVCWMAQVLPFQYSASVTPIPAELMYDPTAMQLADDAHETPSSTLLLLGELGGLGMAWISQPVPALADPADHMTTAAAVTPNVKPRHMIRSLRARRHPAPCLDPARSLPRLNPS